MIITYRGRLMVFSIASLIHHMIILILASSLLEGLSFKVLIPGPVGIPMPLVIIRASPTNLQNWQLLQKGPVLGKVVLWL